jgi:hypothetical protein
MWDNTKEFECFWGYGYVKPEEKSKLEYHKLDFFTEANGYEFLDFKEINSLDVGDTCNMAQAFNEHWIRRMK